jgi:nitroimidazol reductase NimA-like FMN-containing flavoprotein (pyridoxamine 5'-phosphate oxidase superfamily)
VTMRRKDKEIASREEIDGIIRDSLVCRLALSLGGSPYIVPFSFGYDGEAIYVHTARRGKKIGYFEGNPAVCFEFDRGVKLHRKEGLACGWSLSFESVIGQGTIHELTDPGEKGSGLNQIMLQYSDREWDFDPATLSKTRVWKVAIESITGKRSPGE